MKKKFQQYPTTGYTAPEREPILRAIVFNGAGCLNRRGMLISASMFNQNAVIAFPALANDNRFDYSNLKEETILFKDILCIEKAAGIMGATLKLLGKPQTHYKYAEAIPAPWDSEQVLR